MATGGGSAMTSASGVSTSDDVMTWCLPSSIAAGSVPLGPAADRDRRLAHGHAAVQRDHGHVEHEPDEQQRCGGQPPVHPHERDQQRVARHERRDGHVVVDPAAQRHDLQQRGRRSRPPTSAPAPGRSCAGCRRRGTRRAGRRRRRSRRRSWWGRMTRAGCDRPIGAGTSPAADGAEVRGASFGGAARTLGPWRRRRTAATSGPTASRGRCTARSPCSSAARAPC